MVRRSRQASKEGCSTLSSQTWTRPGLGTSWKVRAGAGAVTAGWGEGVVSGWGEAAGPRRGSLLRACRILAGLASAGSWVRAGGPTGFGLAGAGLSFAVGPRMALA